ncbi:MAG: hypothetical protein WDW38_006105 [Sanguina aurantia]
MPTPCIDADTQQRCRHPAAMPTPCIDADTLQRCRHPASTPTPCSDAGRQGGWGGGALAELWQARGWGVTCSHRQVAAAGCGFVARGEPPEGSPRESSRPLIAGVVALAGSLGMCALVWLFELRGGLVWVAETG